MPHRYFLPASDGPRDLQIHACQEGGEWEREHPLFHDFLRADATRESAMRASSSSSLPATATNRLAYNGAKTGFIPDTLGAAEEWAGGVDWWV